MGEETFSAAWKSVDMIQGWLTRCEAMALFQAATRIPVDGQIVEIGSYRGRSAALLAQTGRNVLAIDPLNLGTNDNYVICDGDAAALEGVVAKYPNLSWRRIKSTDTPLEECPKIDLLYIDGDHEGDAPLNDFKHFQPLLSPNAVVAFHDYGTFPRVAAAVHYLENEGLLERHGIHESMYIGRVQDGKVKPVRRKLLFLARPSYGPYEPESDYAAHHAVSNDDKIEVHAAGFRLSMTCKNCNDHLCSCMNRGGYDYFAMLHADVAPDEGWAETLIEQLEAHDYDVIHAPCAFKNETGITSTAIGYSDNIWAPVRRITTTELMELPETFDVDVLRDVYDPEAERMLLNTGCMVFRIGDWINKFPGFSMADRFFNHNGTWYSVSVSEDYMFGHWCANNGIRVGATKKVLTSHWGRTKYTTAESWGPERDAEYDRDMAAVREAQMA